MSGGTTHTCSEAESAQRSAGLQQSEGWGMTCRSEEAAPPSMSFVKGKAQGIPSLHRKARFSGKIPIRLGTGQQLATVAQTSIRGLVTARTCVVAGLPRT